MALFKQSVSHKKPGASVASDCFFSQVVEELFVAGGSLKPATVVVVVLLMLVVRWVMVAHDGS